MIEKIKFKSFKASYGLTAKNYIYKKILSYNCRYLSSNI